jgi:hypothetical protein
MIRKIRQAEVPCRRQVMVALQHNRTRFGYTLNAGPRIGPVPDQIAQEKYLIAFAFILFQNRFKGGKIAMYI